MKNIKFLLGLFSVVILMASCTTMQGAIGDDDMMNDPRTRQIGNRVYMQDPYYGTVVLERDPYTGRYFDVTPGGRFGTGYYGGHPYGGMYRGGGVVRGNNRSFGGNGNVVRQQAPSREQVQQNRAETRRRVLGN